MTTPTHATLGFAIGAALGHPLLGAVVAVVVDVDHLVTYARQGVLRNPHLFWKTVTDNEDPYGSQRGWLHSLLVATPLGVVIAYTFGSLAPTIILSYASHLFLDLLDSADYWPLYPFKLLNYRGTIRFFSKQEIFLAASFLVIGLSFII